jgi:phosphopentomutase
MPVCNRAIILVLDGVGCGALPDAASYGPPEADPAANCLSNTADVVGKLALPQMGMLGLGNITSIQGTPPVLHTTGCYGKMAEVSAGKDSTTGHWEIAGIVLQQPFPTYPQGFPHEIIATFEQQIGRTIIGNYPSSGTVIIEKLGEVHLQTGQPIIYTSSDSVFQIAAHEDIVPVAQLYEWCECARALLVPPHGVGRVIARPFSGSPGNFSRTPRRRDFSLPPPAPTLLDYLHDAQQTVIGIGKIGDLFSERGLTESTHPESDAATVASAISWLERSWQGLLFVNLVECDQNYGHRRDPAGYAAALQRVDNWVQRLIAAMRDDDVLFITSDHGTDPTVAGTDHTREYVPLLVAGSLVRKGLALGTRASFADLGATIVDALGTPSMLPHGTSFWNDILSS